MTTMNAAAFHQFGDPARVIEINTIDVPQAGEGEALIKMTMSPIHNHDLITVRGEYGVKPPLPAVGGTEATGIVAALGTGVTGLSIGDRVSIAEASRTWAEYFTVPSTALVPIPAGIDDQIAAQIMGMPMGGVLALNQFDAKAGDWIVVNGGAGAVGKVIAAVGRSRGLNIALIVRSEHSRKTLSQLGFDHVFSSDAEEWKDSLRAKIGDVRVAGGVDMVGGEAAGDIVSLISEHGLMLSFGALADNKAVIDISDLIFRQITVRGFWQYQLVQGLDKAAIKAMQDELFRLAISGQLVLPVERVFPLAQAAEAMATSAGNRSGKVLISA